MRTEHITNRIGMLVRQQVELEQDIIRLTDQLNGTIGHENANSALYGLRDSLMEKRQSVQQIKDNLIALRQTLIETYETELERLDSLQEERLSHDEKLLRKDLIEQIANLKKVLHGNS